MQTSGDLWLISSGLVGTCAQVDSAWWDSFEFLEDSNKESRLPNVSQMLVYMSLISVIFFSPEFFCFAFSPVPFFKYQYFSRMFFDFCPTYMDVKLFLDGRTTLSTSTLPQSYSSSSLVLCQRRDVVDGDPQEGRKGDHQVYSPYALNRTTN